MRECETETRDGRRVREKSRRRVGEKEKRREVDSERVEKERRRDSREMRSTLERFPPNVENPRILNTIGSPSPNRQAQ